ncbi:hypothetical protein ACWDSL_40935 [Streptomyces sp. NPDC000941]
MDEAQLWQLIENQGEREPLITRGEAQAVVEMLQLLGEQGTDVANELATRLARRLPADQ